MRDNSKFDHGRRTAMNTAKLQIDFIMKNINLLKTKRHEFIFEMNRCLLINYPLTDKQLNYLDGCYEAVFKSMGLGGYEVSMTYVKEARFN